MGIIMVIRGKMGRELDSCLIDENMYIDIKETCLGPQEQSEEQGFNPTVVDP